MAYFQTAKQAASLLTLALCLVAVPFVTNDFRAYQLGTYLLYGVVAQGVALVWGRLGFLPLGQALFFGLGAYVAGLLLIHAQDNALLYLLLPLSILVPALLAYLVARLVFAGQYVSGPDFSLITLAFTMLGAQLANQFTGLTGGFNGLANIPQLGDLDRYSSMYFLIVALVLFSTALLSWLYQTPLGTLWLAISQNENRLQFFGFATDKLKAGAFALSAALAGSAGFLYAAQQGLVTPQAIGFQLSAELVIWTAVGGRFGPYGALLGAVGIGLLSSDLREIWVHWEVLVALLFIAVVLYFPGGMAHLLLNAYQFINRRSGTHVPAYAVAPKTPGLRAPPIQSCGGDSGPVHLRFDNVSVQRNEVSILNGLSLAVEHAGVYCLIGPNGAGKTSSFNVLTGRLARTSGDIFLDSQRVTGHRADVMARAGVGRKFQIPSVFNGLSVTDNLRIALWSNRAQARQLLESTTRQWRTDMLDFLENTFTFLADQADKPAGELSQGQRQMLELSMTLLAEPRLLLLDEPCAGLSTAETQQQIEVIVQAVSRLGSTALVIEHDMAAVQRLSNEVFVLHQGQLLANGTLKQMQDSPLVQAVYAGGQK